MVNETMNALSELTEAAAEFRTLLLAYYEKLQPVPVLVIVRPKSSEEIGREMSDRFLVAYAILNLLEICPMKTQTLRDAVVIVRGLGLTRIYFVAALSSLHRNGWIQHDNGAYSLTGKGRGFI